MLVINSTQQDNSLVNFRPMQSAQVREVVLSSGRFDDINMTTTDRVNTEDFDNEPLAQADLKAYQSATQPG